MTAPLKRIVVLGATGFIGGTLLESLKSESRWDVAGYGSSACNLLDQGSVDHVLHTCNKNTSLVVCSAISRVVEDSWAAMLKNATMVHHLLSAIPAGGVRSIIYLSSTDVYGLPTHSLPICELTLPRPNGFYALSKLIAESLFAVQHPTDLPVTLLRLPGIYGLGDQGKSVVGMFLRQVLKRMPVRIDGGGDTKRDFVHIDDLCRVIRRFLEIPVDGMWNVASGTSYSIKAIVQMMFDDRNLPSVVEHGPGRKERDHDLVFDTTRLREFLGDIEVATIEQRIGQLADDLASTEK